MTNKASQAAAGQFGATGGASGQNSGGVEVGSRSGLTVRVIPVLLVDMGYIVQTKHFAITIRIHSIGKLSFIAKSLEAWGADEVVVLDITRPYDSHYRTAFVSAFTQVAEELNVPVTIGGRIFSMKLVHKYLRLGADKVLVNSAALFKPKLISDITRYYGSQVLTVGIDFDLKTGNVWSSRLTFDTGRNYLSWAREAVKLGAGELMLNTRQTDGAGTGYALEAFRRVAEEVEVPVIFMGGVGSGEAGFQHLVDGATAGASGVAAGNAPHYKEGWVLKAKEYMGKNGVNVRTLIEGVAHA